MGARAGDVEWGAAGRAVARSRVGRPRSGRSRTVTAVAVPGPAIWLHHPVASWGYWALDTWQLLEVLLLLVVVVQLAEAAFARVGVGDSRRAGGPPRGITISPSRTDK